MWGEDLVIDLTEGLPGRVLTLVLSVLSEGGEVFGAARVELGELLTTNLIGRQAELPLYSEGGKQTGATLSIRTWRVDFPAFFAEQRELEGRIGAEERRGEREEEELRRDRLRVTEEKRMVEEEMEEDAMVEAVDEGRDVIRHMRAQLLAMVEEQARSGGVEQGKGRVGGEEEEGGENRGTGEREAGKTTKKRGR